MPAVPAMVGVNTTRCVKLAIQAASMENEAMALDRQHQFDAAARRYREAAQGLLEAAEACPPEHPDRDVIESHAAEVLSRARYLENLHGADEPIPLEEHIHGVQLTIGSSPSAARTPAAPSSPPRRSSSTLGDRTVMGAAAAITGATGLFLLGPVSAAALGVAAAYATTREDKAGSAARKLGTVGVQVVRQARTLDEEYRISTRAVAIGHSALDQAKALTSRCGLSERAKILGSFNQRREVMNRLGRGLSSAGSALTSLVSKAP